MARMTVGQLRRSMAAFPDLDDSVVVAVGCCSSNATHDLLDHASVQTSRDSEGTEEQRLVILTSLSYRDPVIEDDDEDGDGHADHGETDIGNFRVTRNG